MTRFIYFLSLISALVLAGEPQVTRGDALKRREYQTYSALTLYVDPTGSDSNACTASGTSACLTLQGALNKLPRFARHNITINIAAGTYSGDWTFQLDVDGQVNTSTIPVIDVIGPSQVAFTPATGTATGTVTAVSQQAAPLSTLTDTGQSWTAHDLRGQFVRFTSGSGGLKLIVDNTATVITYLSANSTAPSVGNTYSIETPAAMLSGAGRLNVNGRTSAVGITLRFANVTLTNNSSTATLTLMSNLRPQFAGVRIINTSSGNGVTSGGTAGITSGVSPGFYVGTDSGRAISLGNGGNIPTLLSFTAGAFAYSASNAAYNSGYGLGAVASGNLVAETGSASGPALVHNGPTTSGGSGGAATGVIAVRCPSGHSGVGAYINSGFEAQNFVAENCGTGVSVGGYSDTYGGLAHAQLYIRGNSTFTNVTTALAVTQGGRIYIPTSPTFTTVTNELSLDGTFFTYADLSAASPSVITNSYGSSISR